MIQVSAEDAKGSVVQMLLEAAAEASPAAVLRKNKPAQHTSIVDILLGQDSPSISPYAISRRKSHTPLSAAVVAALTSAHHSSQQESISRISSPWMVCAADCLIESFALPPSL